MIGMPDLIRMMMMQGQGPGAAALTMPGSASQINAGAPNAGAGGTGGGQIGGIDLSQLLAMFGQREDNAGQGGMVAHIGDKEAKKLARDGGSGTLNPITGLPQFYDVGGGDVGGRDPTGGSGGGNRAGAAGNVGHGGGNGGNGGGGGSANNSPTGQVPGATTGGGVANDADTLTNGAWGPYNPNRSGINIDRTRQNIGDLRGSGAANLTNKEILDDLQNKLSLGQQAPTSTLQSLGSGAANLLGGLFGFHNYPNATSTWDGTTQTTTPNSFNTLDPTKAVLGTFGMVNPLGSLLSMLYSGATALGMPASKIGWQGTDIANAGSNLSPAKGPNAGDLAGRTGGATGGDITADGAPGFGASSSAAQSATSGTPTQTGATTLPQATAGNPLVITGSSSVQMPWSMWG